MRTKPTRKVPASEAGLKLRLSYNQVRQRIAVGKLRGGFDPKVGFFVDSRELNTLKYTSKKSRPVRPGTADSLEASAAQ